MRPFSHLAVWAIRPDSPPWRNNPLPLRDCLTKYRRQSSLTQEALATQIGASIESIKNWEAGRVRPVKQFWPAIRSILTTL